MTALEAAGPHVDAAGRLFGMIEGTWHVFFAQ
jgi:hypothetical protein